jgi:uncharacterized integral membrane protein
MSSAAIDTFDGRVQLDLGVGVLHSAVKVTLSESVVHGPQLVDVRRHADGR